jgi:peptide/nickel transport system substrate-binding protein
MQATMLCCTIRRRAIAVVAVGALATALVAAAGSAAAATGAPHTFVKVVAGLPTSVDPVNFQGRPSSDNLQTFTSPLIRTKGLPRGAKELPGPYAVEPFLATSWTRGPDGSWTFKLRENAKSPAGNTLTADDVKWSFDRGNALDGVARFLFSAGNIDARNPITVIDAGTVRVNVTRPGPMTLGALVPYLLAVYDSTEAKKHATPTDPWAKEWLGSHSATFGPYYVDSIDPGKTIVLKKNPNFWNAKTMYFDTVVMQAIPDSATRLQLMLTGEADNTYYLSGSHFKAAVNEDGKKLVAYPDIESSMDMMLLNEAFGPFSDIRVRKAINMGILRSGLIKTVYQGFGKPARYQFSSVLPQTTGFEPISYNPAKAKQLLADAGQSNLEFTLTTSPGVLSYGADIATYIQSQLALIGVKVNVEVIASPSEFEAKRLGGKLTAWINTLRPAIADAMFFTFLTNGTKGILNGHKYSNAKVDKLVSLMLGTSPGPRYDRELKELLRIVTDEAPTVPLVEVPTQVVLARGITGYRTRPVPIVFVDELTRSS